MRRQEGWIIVKSMAGEIRQAWRVDYASPIQEYKPECRYPLLHLWPGVRVALGAATALGPPVGFVRDSKDAMQPPPRPDWPAGAPAERPLVLGVGWIPRSFQCNQFWAGANTRGVSTNPPRHRPQ